TMFANLHKYSSWDFAKNHRKITFNTLYEDMEWEVFACYEAHVDFPYINVTFQNDEEFMSLMTQCKKMSKFDFGITPKVNDRILTLSTCVKGNRPDYRWVVQAILVKRTVR